MKTPTYLILDHDPDTELLTAYVRERNGRPMFAAGYLQAVAVALRSRPDIIMLRRDLPWAPQRAPQIFLESPLFSATQIVFYLPDELRGQWPSSNMVRPLGPKLSVS